MDIEATKEYINQFEKKYGYDSQYMRDLLDFSPAVAEKFNTLSELVNQPPNVAVDAYFVAKLSSIQVADCGQCLQLNIKMAKEYGVDKNLIENLVKNPEQLPQPLLAVHQLAAYDPRNSATDNKSLLQRVVAAYGREGAAELAFTIAAAKIYPYLKRAMGHGQSCSLMEVEF